MSDSPNWPFPISIPIAPNPRAEERRAIMLDIMVALIDTGDGNPSLNVVKNDAFWLTEKIFGAYPDEPTAIPLPEKTPLHLEGPND